jgi:DNA polymerase delta subunit 4
LQLTALQHTQALIHKHINRHHTHQPIMPPKRRTTDRTTSTSRQQSTLSFNGKTSRVTKASQQHQQHGKDLEKKKELLFDEAVSRTDVPQDDDVVELATKPTTADKAVEHQAEVEARALEKAASVKSEEVLTGGSKTEDVLGGRAQTSDVGAVGGPVGSGWVGDEETRARKITETQIKKFWREKENDRLVPRVHQEDLGVHERVLRLWDISGEYGVSSGTCEFEHVVSIANISANSRVSALLD